MCSTLDVSASEADAKPTANIVQVSGRRSEPAQSSEDMPDDEEAALAKAASEAACREIQREHLCASNLTINAAADLALSTLEPILTVVLPLQV